MSEAPTHAAVPTPTPARPQQAERTPQTERTPQQSQSQQAQSQQAQSRPGQAQQEQAQRPEPNRTEPNRTESQRTESQQAGQRPSSKLEDEWQAVQYEFVDDPKAAVRKADGLVTRAIEELADRHRSLTKQLEGKSDPQTEDLRLALHRYRELFRSLVAVK